MTNITVHQSRFLKGSSTKEMAMFSERFVDGCTQVLVLRGNIDEYKIFHKLMMTKHMFPADKLEKNYMWWQNDWDIPGKFTRYDKYGKWTVYKAGCISKENRK